MIAPTHAIYGPALALIILGIFGIQASLHWSVILCAMLGSLVPDLDYAGSTIGRLLPWISKRLEQRYGHRSITHSLAGSVVASLIFTLLIGSIAWLLHSILLRSAPVVLSNYGIWALNLTFSDIIRLGIAFFIGYLSHLLLDMFTPRGVQLFWPSPNRDTMFKDTIQIPTGSKSEIPVALIGIALLILAFPLSEYGPMTALRWFLATPEAAIQEFKNRDTRTFVEFEGTWANTKQPIKATAEILDVDNKRLVVVLNSASKETPGIPSVPLPRPATRPGAIPLQKSRANQNAPTQNPNTLHPSATPLAGHRPVSTQKPQPNPNSVSAATVHGPQVVTLSDELTADITTRKVRLKTTQDPRHSKVIEFNQKSRDDLLQKITDSDLVSGVIELPPNLPLIIPDEERTFKSIRFSNNSLILRFATKSQLAQLRLDQAFDLQKKELTLKRKRLRLQKKRIQQHLHDIDHPQDGLTDLGRKLLTTDDEIKKQQQKKEQLEQQLEQVEFEIEQTEVEAKRKELLFSGRVRVWEI